MPQNWKTYKLGDGIETIIDYRGKTPRKSPSGIPLISAATVKKGKLDFTKASFISEDDYKLWVTRGFTRPFDVLITTEAPVGEVALYPNDGKTYLISRRVIALRADEEKLHSKFLLHLLQYKPTVEALLANNRGSTVPRVLKTDITDLKLNLPNIQVQRKIASILSTIDDKIELNLAMNKTLEDMAMALYKHWFLDFEPFQDGEFIDSELGMIPEGWEVKRLKDFVVLTMGQSPKSEFYNDNCEGLPFHQGVTNYGIRFPKDITYSTSGNREAVKGDILFSVRAPVGRLNISKNKIILGRGLASMHMSGNNNFLFYALKTMFSSEDIIGSGTVFNSVNKTDLQNLEFAIPSVEILLKFKTIVEPIDHLYLEKSNEIETLTKLRDTLLPKLISGEVRVKDVEQQISEVLWQK